MFSEIYEYSTQPYMIFWSILVLVLAVLALLSAISGVDADFDLDADIEVDGELGGDISGDGLFEKVCIFFNVGDIPVTLIIFSFILSNWFLGLITNNIINTSHSVTLGFILSGVIFIISIPFTKVVIYPLKKVFCAMKEGDEKQNHILGNICETVTDVSQTRGQATIETSTAPLDLMVECEEGITIPKGSKAVVLEHNKNSNRYIITKLDDDIL